MKKRYSVKRFFSSVLIVSMVFSLNAATGVFAESDKIEQANSVTMPSYITETVIGGEKYLEFDSGEDMAWLRAHVMNKEDGGGEGGYYCTHNIVLTDDIDMSEYNNTNGENNGAWSGIGHGQQWIGYSGIFDGAGHTISNIDVYNDQLVGPKGLLFNITKNATIKNISVEGVVSSTRYIGGLVGRTTGGITLENVVVDAKLSLSNGNANAIGGLIGQCGSGQTVGGDKILIKNCAAVGSFESSTSTNPIGGLIGHIYGGYDVQIENTYAAADLRCDGGNVAGLIGSQGTSKLRIANCYYLDAMAETAFFVMSGSNADESPVSPSSSFVDVKEKKIEEMKSSSFIESLGSTKFHADGQPPLAQGCPLPATISAKDYTFSEFIWSGEPVTAYNIGDSFDMGSLKVIARYKNSSDQTLDVNVTKYLKADKNILQKEDNNTNVTLTLSYGDRADQKEYPVTVKNVVELEIENGPSTTLYYEGEKFNPQNLCLKATFSDNTTKTIMSNEYTYSPAGELTTADTEIKVSYGGQTVSVPIEVKTRNIVSLEVTEKPNLIYTASENFDPTGMKVRVNYDNTEYGRNYRELELSFNGKYAAGKYIYSADGNRVTVSYQEKEQIFQTSFDIFFLSGEAPEKIEDVYQLSTPDDMIWFANQVNEFGKKDINGAVQNDIDLSSAAYYLPIGIDNKTFYAGTFDGKGHTITVAFGSETGSADNTRKNIGLFGACGGGAQIENVIVNGTIDGTFEAAVNFAGIVASTFTVNGSSTAVQNCTNQVKISVETKNANSVGGIIGSAASPVIINCSNEADLSGNTVGGITVASSRNEIEITNCANSGDITASTVAGGIIPTGYGGSIKGCWNSGEGKCLNKTKGAGGIIYEVSILSQSSINISDCYNTGQVTGIKYSGGIVGYMKGKTGFSLNIDRVYSSGSVLLGEDAAAGNCGMIVGYVENSAALNNAIYLNNGLSAYNEKTQGIVTMENTFSKTAEELKSDEILQILGEAFTFAHSDTINSGYPVLTWQAAGVADDVHVWDEGVVTKEPTTQETGEKEYTCMVCGAKKTEVLDKLSSGGSGGGGSSVKPDDGKGETVTNPDGSVTTTTKDEETGSVTEKTEYKDGSEFTKTTSSDGKVQSEAVVSEEAVKAAADSGQPVVVAMPEAESKKDAAKAPELTVDLPCAEAVVEIPVADMGSGVVAVIVNEDGSEKIVKISEVTERGIVLNIKDGQTVKIADNSKAFSDCANHWASEAVNFVTSREIFNGTGEGAFSPNNSMTRGMLMTVLARLNGVDTDGGATWYEKGLEWAVTQGISDGTNPDQSVSREQLVTMLWRASGSPENSGSLGSFTDADSVSSYAADAMSWAISKGLITGTDKNELIPGSDATRAQVATIMMRYCAMLLD